MHKKTTISRFEYPEDRLNYNVWVKAPGPTQTPYWIENIIDNNLHIRLYKNGNAAEQILNRLELMSSAAGWRSLVATAITNVRKFLKYRDESLIAKKNEERKMICKICDGIIRHGTEHSKYCSVKCRKKSAKNKYLRNKNEQQK